MVEGRAEASPGAGADGAGLLLAVERVGADVAALTRLLAAQPAEVAARVDIDSATAGSVMLLGTLGSALDQLRLSLLAGLDRAAERVDQPSWLPELLEDLAGLGSRVEAAGAQTGQDHRLNDLTARLDQPTWLPELKATLGQIGARPAPEDGLASPLADLATRIEQAVADAAEGTRLQLAALTTPPGMPPGEAAEQVDAASGRIASRISAMGNTLDQLRISLLGELDRVGERLDRPAWLPELQSAVGDEVAALPLQDDLGSVLGELKSRVTRVLDDPRLDEVATAVADLSERVTPLPDRLKAIAVLVDRLTPLARAGDEAGSLIAQLDRVSSALDQVLAQLAGTGAAAAGAQPVAEASNERPGAIAEVLAGVTRGQDEVTAAVNSVLDQVRGPMGIDTVLERMEQRERSLAARLDRIDAQLRGGIGEAPTPQADTAFRPDDPTAAASASAADAQSGALGSNLEQLRTSLLEGLDRVADRLDQPRWLPQLQNVTEDAAAARAADDLNTVLDRMEQRERSLVARLDRIDSELHRRTDGRAEDGPRPDLDAARVLRVVLEAVERQERTLSAQLDHLDADVRTIAAGPASATVVAWAEPTALETVLDRLDQQQRAVARQLSWVGDRLAEVATHLTPADSPPAEAGRSRAVDEAVAHLDRREQAEAMRLDRMEVELHRSIAARPAEPRSDDSGTLKDAVDGQALARSPSH